jgi:hypothetical protein
MRAERTRWRPKEHSIGYRQPAPVCVSSTIAFRNIPTWVGWSGVAGHDTEITLFSGLRFDAGLNLRGSLTAR